MTLHLRSYVPAATATRMVAEATTVTWVLVGTDRGVTESSIGLVVAFATFPQIVLAPWIGRRADLASQPALLLALLIGIGGGGFALVGAGLGTVPVGLLLLAAVLVALGAPAMMGALSGIAARSTDAAKFEAWDAASYGSAAIGAQLAVVVMVAAWNASAAVVAIGTLAVLAVVAVGRLPLRPVHVRDRDGTGIRTVLATIAADRDIRSITLLTTVSMSAFGGTAFVAVELAERAGRPSDTGSHLILAMAIGAAAGALVCLRMPSPARPLRQAAVSVAVIGVAFAVSPIAWPVALCAFAVAGFADAPLLVATFAIRNRHSPDSMRASLYTVSASLKIGGTALGAIGIGMIVGAFGASAGALSLAAIQAVALLAVACSRRTVSRNVSSRVDPVRSR